MSVENNRKLKYQLWGWILFIACALLFISSSIIYRDFVALAGSFLFLIACILFLVPLLGDLKNDGRWK